MAYYAYKQVRDMLPKHIIDDMGPDYDGDPNYDGDLWDATAIYIEELLSKIAALQAKREPLSDLRILNIAEVVDGKTRTREDLFVDFTRAIEAAHGIAGGEK